MAYSLFYSVYKLTNQINQKIYIGVHATSNLDDGYMGSGSAIISAIERHGKDSFTKEILHVFDNPQDMYNKEAEIVTEKFVQSRNNYNLKMGGTGGWDYVNRLGLSMTEKRHQAAIRNFTKKQEGYLKWYASHDREEFSKKIKEGKKKSTKIPGSFLGKSHSNETKNAIGTANSISQSGCRNSQYGTKWAVNPETGLPEKVSADNLPLLVSQGWIPGRKVKAP